MPELTNLDDIKDEEVLQKMLSDTEGFDERRLIRARLRDLRSSPGLKDKGKMSASEEAVTRSTKTETNSVGGTTTTTTTTTRETSKDGSSNTMKQTKQITQRSAPGGTNIVITKTSADKCAKRLARIFTADGRETSSGQINVKTEGWNSTQGTTNRNEKTVAWGGRVSSSTTPDFRPTSGGLSPLSPTSPGGRVAVQRSPSTIKQFLLDWCVRMTQEYESVHITNFSSSWNDGMAFCALMHHFYPRAFDYKKLNPKCRRGNFKLAFDVADKLGGIAPLLDVDDMVRMKNPDWKCVFTYVQSIYRHFRDNEANAQKKEESKAEEKCDA